jgi:hypothetical protein
VSQKQYPGFVEEEVGYYTPIPAKYEAAMTSGLTVTVAAGNMTRDIELKSK